MAELYPPEGPNDAPITTATTTAAAAAITIIPAAADITNIAASASASASAAAAATNNNRNLGPSLGPKRQRRPSVRLGEIGDQPATLSYDSHAPRRPNKPWRFYKDPGLLAAKSSKTRPLTNLVNGHEILETDDNLDFGNRKPKSKRPATKRVRTNWTGVTKVVNGIEGEIRDDNNYSGEFRDFEPEVEGSESPLKEQSPLQSVDNVGVDLWHHRGTGSRARVSESRDRDDGVPETSGDRNFGSGSEERGRNRNGNGNGFLDDGVRNWLIGLGLGRYAPVFEIHEVDGQVLPLLTLEDLKDMGINAVGSRRKLYSAIQKLPKEFS